MANLSEAAVPATPAPSQTPTAAAETEPAKPAGLSSSESGYSFTPKEGAPSISQTTTGNSAEGTIRYFGTSPDGNSGYAVYPDGSVYSYSGPPGSAVLGTVNSSGTSAVGKIETSPSSSGFASYTPYPSSPPVSTASTGVAAPITNSGSTNKSSGNSQLVTAGEMAQARTRNPAPAKCRTYKDAFGRVRSTCGG
jgi:hypothetical protein